MSEPRIVSILQKYSQVDNDVVGWYCSDCHWSYNPVFIVNRTNDPTLCRQCASKYPCRYDYYSIIEYGEGFWGRIVRHTVVDFEHARLWSDTDLGWPDFPQLTKL